MFDIITQFKNAGILDLFSVLLSTIVPLAVLFKTLNHSKKQFNIQICEQHKKHIQTIENMERRHYELIKQQSEHNRTMAMPYLVIDKSNIAISTENNNIYFNISFTNKGNGIAIKLTGDYLSTLSESYLCPMCETFSAVYVCACPFDYETGILKINETSNMMLCQQLKASNSTINIDKVNIRILFQDLYFNQYEQQFMLLFSNQTHDDSIEINRVSVNPPKLSVK